MKYKFSLLLTGMLSIAGTPIELPRVAYAQTVTPVIASVAPSTTSLTTSLKIAAPNTMPIRPLRGMSYTLDMIEEVRRLARGGANSQQTQKILQQAQEWLNRSDAQIIALLPAPDALYANGTAGDPKTGQPWPSAARSDNMASIDRPGEIRSPHTGDIYGIAKPGEPYYDDGKGWVRPSDGRRFFFKGMWNAFITRAMHDGVDNLALAYLLTGEPETARKALFMFDQMATLLARTPADHRTADEYGAGGHTRANHFFMYAGNGANQRALNSAMALDLIAAAPAASAPSSFKPELSKFENIRDNYFNVYEREYYIDERMGLTNHASIAFANMLAQGVLFGRRDYLETGIDGLYAFMDSVINRDGDYIEVAGGYGRIGRDYGAMYVAPLVNYDPKNYPNGAELPDPKKFPHQLHFADDYRWYQQVVGMLYSMTVLNRFPQYGDWRPDREVLLKNNNVWLDAFRWKYLRMFHAQTTREDWKREIEAHLRELPPQDPAVTTLEELLLYGVSQWQMPHETAPKSAPATSFKLQTELMGAKGIAILRSGEGVNRRELFMRGGPNGPHGHDDQMSIIPTGHGMELSGVYGYSLSESVDHLSWGTRAIAHLTPTINEDLPYSYLYKGARDEKLYTGRGGEIFAPSATVEGFVAGAPAQFVEMSNPKMWSHVANDIEDYRRTAWLIDTAPDAYYFVDVFQMVGGRVHDYPWNAPYQDKPTEHTFRVTDIRPKPVPGAWTLAALSGRYRDEEWNQPGQSWGERLDGKAGRILPLPGKDEKSVPGRKQIARPGNGYGFIWDVKAAETDKDWTALWKLHDNEHYLRAWMMNYDGMTAITSKTPTLLRAHHHDTIIARRTREGNSPLQSRFVNVVEVGKPNQWSVQKSEKMPLHTSGRAEDAAGLKLQLKTGATDYILHSRTTQAMDGGAIKLNGRNGFACLAASGTPLHLMMQDSTSLQAGGWKIETEKAAFETTVVSVQAGLEESRVTIKGELPAGGVLSGAMLFFGNTPGVKVPYTHGEYYRVEEVQPAGAGKSTLVFKKQSLVSARFQVDQIDKEKKIIHTRWPSEVAGMPGTHYLRGHAIVEDGQALPLAVVHDYFKKDIYPSTLEGFKTGVQYNVLTAAPGGTVHIPTTVSLTQKSANRYELRSTSATKLTIPVSIAGTKLFVATAGKPERAFVMSKAAGVLEVTLSPNEFKSGVISLRIQP